MSTSIYIEVKPHSGQAAGELPGPVSAGEHIYIYVYIRRSIYIYIYICIYLCLCLYLYK